MADHDRYIDSIKVLNEQLLAQLDAEKSGIDQRRAGAHRELAQCDIDENGVEEKRKSILQAQAMQLAYLDSLPSSGARIVSPQPPTPTPTPTPPTPPAPTPPAPPPSSVPQAQAKRADVIHATRGVGIAPHVAVAVAQPTTDAVTQRARVGPQRYLILTSLRAGAAMTLGEIIKATGLSERRIRDQLRSDIGVGVIDEVVVGIAHKYRLSKAGGELLRRFEQYRRSMNRPLPTMEDAKSEDARQSSANIFS